MKILTIKGEDAEGNIQPFHIINPMNVIVHKGTVQKEGTLRDDHGELIPVDTDRTFVRVGGQPLFSVDSVDEVLLSIRELDELKEGANEKA